MANKAELDIIISYTMLAHLIEDKNWAAVRDTIYQTLAAAKGITVTQARQDILNARESKFE